MAKKQAKEQPLEVLPEKRPGEVNPSIEPEEPFMPDENPEVIPEEDPFEDPPYEMPSPGEGP